MLDISYHTVTWSPVKVRTKMDADAVVAALDATDMRDIVGVGGDQNEAIEDLRVQLRETFELLSAQAKLAPRLERQLVALRTLGFAERG